MKNTGVRSLIIFRCVRTDLEVHIQGLEGLLVELIGKNKEFVQAMLTTEQKTF